MKTALAILLALTGTTVITRAQRPLTDWEIRTGTSQAAQQARADRQRAEFNEAERASQARRQADEDARDPIGAALRRAEQRYRAATTPTEKDAALADWKIILDARDRKLGQTQQPPVVRQLDDAMQHPHGARAPAGVDSQWYYEQGEKRWAEQQAAARAAAAAAQAAAAQQQIDWQLQQQKQKLDELERKLRNR